jgi:hypothetical protein
LSSVHNLDQTIEPAVIIAAIQSNDIHQVGIAATKATAHQIAVIICIALSLKNAKICSHISSFE